MARDRDFAATLANYVGQADFAASLNSSGKLPSTQLPSGTVVQVVYVNVTGFTTTNGTITGNNDPITDAMGSSFGLSVTMKPTLATNKVYVLSDLYGSSEGGHFFWGLFLAASSSAVIAGGVQVTEANALRHASFIWQATTVSAASTTYALRIAGQAGVTTLNGQVGAGRFNNSMITSLLVCEVQN